MLETVPKGKTGVVQTDLACAPGAVGVFLENGATLDLNGHVLDGCGVSQASGTPSNSLRINVRGPGEIRNAGAGIYLAGSLRAANLIIRDASDYGVYGGNGADAHSTLRLKDVQITGCGSFAVHGSRVVARRVTATGNGTTPGLPAIVGWNGVVGRELTVSGNTSGIFSAAGTTRINDSQITDNQTIGVQGFHVVLANSTVTGNTTVGPPTEADVVSSSRPTVRNTTCGTSLRPGQDTSWGVCTGD